MMRRREQLMLDRLTEVEEQVDTEESEDIEVPKLETST